ncbi:MAG: DUF2851 family protein [Chloroflexi bacterium]|nr:DUF2851 family protein [Chloroflexota bacterium]
MTADTEKKITERQVLQLWQTQQVGGSAMFTEEGEPLRILYPGRPNDSHGADFRDAAITLGNQTLRGDIEVHIKSSDWLAHRHHQDPFYDAVILHVVMWHDITRTPPRHDGRPMPTLALSKYLNVSPPRVVEPSDYFSQFPACLQGESVTEELLAMMGAVRFQLKTAQFEIQLSRIDDSECLYQGVMEALGYSQNQSPFRKLAQRMPLRVLEMLHHQEASAADRLMRIQSRLLGTAGLLPSQCSQYRNSLSLEWAALESEWLRYDQSQAMSPHAWHLFRLRPNNSPLRRIAAMSHLLLRYPEGLLAGAMTLVQKADDYRRLEQGLIVTIRGEGPGHTAPLTLLGRERAGEIIINVILPFLYAWSRINARTEVADKAFSFYQNYPRLGSNTVEKHMISQLGLSRRRVNSAQHQQGLIHIYKSFCTQGECASCPLHHHQASRKLGTTSRSSPSDLPA